MSRLIRDDLRHDECQFRLKLVYEIGSSCQIFGPACIF